MVSAMRFLLVASAALLVLVALVHAYPQQGGAPSDDLLGDPQSRGYPAGPAGRTKWQVYRGPNQGYGKGGKFAPWGYYLVQPKDGKGYY